MTVKSAVSFIDEHHAFAKAAVERGEFASVSAVVAAGIQRLRDEEDERSAMLDAVAEEIRRRAETPDDEFVEHARGDFARILERMIADRAGDDPV
ncbi:MAG: type II toxin-antitoxin system ParD family antitoxin [Immundisolibacterales bacterium]|nr:type II toxin-antitoxin system ParD family antitoxin [Immundisolibacterales bacterium]